MFYQYYDIIKARYYDRLCRLPPVTREAMIFKYTCEEIPLSIRDDDLLPGRYGAASDDELPPDAAALLQEVRDFPGTDAFTPDERAQKDALYERFGIILRFDRAHCCIDNARILSCGLRSCEEEVRAALTESVTQEKRLMLEAMLIAIDAVRLYARRFAGLADALYRASGEPRLARMRDAMLRVPYEPSRDVYEGLCAVWTMHSLVPIAEASWASVSLGRLDQYLLPLYERSLAAGETRENVREYLKNLYRLLNVYGDGACALNIGGLDADGRDMTNDLSRLLIEVERALCTASPIFTVRVHPGTPDDVLDAVITPALFTIGQPTFYGELSCREAMRRRGVPEQSAVGFTVNSCMGLYLPGEEIASMWGCVFNMHLPLELALCGGVPLSGALPFAVDAFPGGIPDSLESLLDAYSHYLRALLVPILRFNRKNAENCAANRPDPLLSALTADCIRTGRDRAVGARYNTETVETMALANTANAIAAVDTLVFRQKAYSLSRYLDAARRDFEGETQLLRDIRACEKYGTHSAYADGIAQRLCAVTAAHCRALSFDNVAFLPSLHTLDTNVSFGARLCTTLDGRLRGTPVAKNAGPTNDVRGADPTAMLLSAASLHQELFSGGQPVDLYFDRALTQTPAGREKIRALIRTYFDLGGLQLQVNSADPALLERAYAHPEDYPQLVVRIGGYSRRFAELSRASQREFIERFRREQV